MTEERVFAELQSDASTLHESIRMHLERNFAPDARKYLRNFSSTEAAEFLGLAASHGRIAATLHADLVEMSQQGAVVTTVCEGIVWPP